MNMVKYALSVVITILGFAAYAAPYADNGGRVFNYTKPTLEAKKNGTKVVIDYECNSACLIKLSSGDGLCVSKKAKFGVHEPHFAPGNLDYDQGVRVEKFVRYFKNLLPLCAVNLFNSKNAFNHPWLTYFTGKEVLKSCPKIKECE